MSTKPAQLTNPVTQNNDWGSVFKFGSPPWPPSILRTSIDASYNQLTTATAVHTGFKINAYPSWREAQQAADWQILPWTLTQIALGGGSVLPFPVSPWNTLLHVYSTFLTRSYSHLLSSCTPLFLLLYFLGSLEYGTALSLCLEADRCKRVGSNSLWGVTPGSPSLHFPSPLSLRGCHGGPDRWSRKERENSVAFCSMSSYVRVYVRVYASCACWRKWGGWVHMLAWLKRI